MVRQSLVTALAVIAMLCFPLADSSGRGFGGGGRSFGGGGGFRGGGGRSFGGGGGFAGGGGRSFGGGGGFAGGGGRSFGGGGGFAGGGGLGGQGGDRFGGLGGGGLGGGGLGGGGLGDRGLGGAGGLGGGRLGAEGGDRFGGLGVEGGRGGQGLGAQGLGGLGAGARPNRGQLNSFLGLPSDSGMHNLSSTSLNTFRGVATAGGSADVNINRGAIAGPRGGAVAGGSVTGPQGNTAYRGAAVGPEGGVAAGRGVVGAGGASAAQGVVEGPGGRVAGGTAVRGPAGGEAARGFAAGPGGYAAGFRAVSPSGRYTAAAGVRGNFDHWSYFQPDWYAAHPGAWRAAGWTAGYAWRAATWNSLDDWFGYGAVQPVEYDYGTNVTYQDNSVYINGQDAGTADQYYQQSQTLADSGTQAEPPSDGDWLPLGVFAFCQPDNKDSQLVLQLAVNKQGVIRGNYTDEATGKTSVIHGSVDKKTQRVAFTVGDNKDKVVETGLYNLTKDEAPCLLHLGADRTEQWLLVRLSQDQQQASSGQSGS